MIIVFGSINVDIAVTVDQMPSPGETVVGGEYTISPGGKGANQACAAALAGEKVALFGKVGSDAFADLALSSLRQAGVDLTGVAQTRSPTGCAVITIDSCGENSIVVAKSANWEARSSQVPDSLLDSNSLLLLQMEVEAEENWKLALRAKKNGAKVILNLAPFGQVPLAVLECLDYLILNQLEARQLAASLNGPSLDSGLDPELDPEIEEAELAQWFYEKFQINTIMTLGKRGSLYASPNAVLKVPTLEVKPIDTTGAGDTFAGVLTAGLGLGYDIETALRRASVASALCCTHLGAQSSTPSQEEINIQLHNLPPITALN